MINVLINGASGRMGTTNVRVFSEDKEIKIVGGIVEKGNPSVGRDIGEVAGIGNIGVKISDNVEDYIEKSDVIVDFSVPSSTSTLIDLALKYNKKLVIGTTGLDKSIMDKVVFASEKIAIVQSPNFSIGVNLMFELVKKASLVLGENFDVEIIEIHHNKKKDSPSGTALKLLESIKEHRKDYNTIYGREGIIGERPSKEIGVFAIRGGDVIGEHNVMFLGYGERIEIIHKASSRETFSRGALRATKFLYTQNKGLFSMKDVLGL
ncbi:MAG: 4-hydroxy-tetrahydrodipicolinate reductase [Brevinematales bacterium]|nr:4-hydroxy-tetrahydrodipicolinate reductase [Brevinematales bacterium]